MYYRPFSTLCEYLLTFFDVSIENFVIKFSLKRFKIFSIVFNNILKSIRPFSNVFNILWVPFVREVTRILKLRYV